MSQLAGGLCHGVVPDEQEAGEQLGAGDGPDHQQLAQALSRLSAQLEIGLVENLGEDRHHTVATLCVQLVLCESGALGSHIGVEHGLYVGVAVCSVSTPKTLSH